MTPERLEALRQEVAESVGRELKISHLEGEELRRGIEELVRRKAGSEYMTPTQRLDIVERIYRSYRGLGREQT